jgi:hypothetical protein
MTNISLIQLIPLILLTGVFGALVVATAFLVFGAPLAAAVEYGAVAALGVFSVSAAAKPRPTAPRRRQL